MCKPQDLRAANRTSWSCSESASESSNFTINGLQVTELVAKACGAYRRCEGHQAGTFGDKDNIYTAASAAEDLTSMTDTIIAEDKTEEMVLISTSQSSASELRSDSLSAVARAP